ncbi:MAG: RecX family transcriptional regulator [Bacteroidaceae bacterium]|nr:RecX family transcriptional regulator [Bacteroidaceae bacterium]
MSPLQRLSSLCAKKEICEQDAISKLFRWGVPEEEHSKIMAQLTAHGFIDNRRYAAAYIEDKMKFNRWGMRKIVSMLRSKGIDDCIIQDAASEVCKEEGGGDNLRAVIEEKKRMLRTETDPNKKRQKLIRYALSKGYEYEDIADILDDIE